jgi:hypothetical protein
MKKIISFILFLTIVAVIVPSVALAAWWNPFTWNWNIFDWFSKPQTATVQQNQNTNQTTNNGRVAIVKNFWEGMLRSLESQNVNLDKRVEDYTINKISIYPVKDNCFGATIDFSVESYNVQGVQGWEAGNGNVDGYWVRNKEYMINAVEDGNGNYTMKSIGTGRANDDCTTGTPFVNNATTQTSTSQTLSVAGTQEYTDANFGFSFWYPSSWNVQNVAVKNPKVYSSGTVTKQLNVTNGQRLITIEEFSSPTFSINDSTGVGACPVCVSTSYYFDDRQHTWMIEFPNGTTTGPPTGPAIANVSSNTMGGLHMLGGSQRFEANTIIPLSASNFIIVTVDGGIATGSSDPKALAETVIATNPAVATPVSAEEQTKTIQAEISALNF